MNLLRKSALVIAATCALAASAFTLDLPTENINNTTYYVYRVAPKETVYSITRKLGITRDELIAANPAVADGLRAGDVLYFPVDATPAQQPTPSKPEKAPKVIEQTECPEVETKDVVVVAPQVEIEAVEVIEPDEPQDSLTVAIMLPFMLESENITKTADNFTKFYCGFLLALDSLGSQSELPVKVLAFDSEGSANIVERLISRQDVRNADFIIAPEDSPSIEIITSVADSTNASVLNLFAVKNDAHHKHESLFQGNISHDLMYKSAIKAFCNANKHKKVIFLNATDIPAEKAEFTKELIANLAISGIPYEQLNYAGKLTDEDLAALNRGKEYVFVPTSHSREALMRFLPALEAYRNLNSSASLFGFPEWIVLQGDIKTKLHKLNTTIYSRFASDYNSADYMRVASSYENAFGEPLDKALPVSALLGFDTAAWILRAAEKGTSTPYQGIQNAFKFVEITDGGNENSALFFLNFTPSGSTEAVLL